MAKIRSPIIAVLGHVDHGKTTLLDRIRGTTIAKAEAGLITQHISSSYVPIKVIREICGNLLNQLNIDLTIPGLLFIDTPGHEAFTTLRKRGGAIADLAVLIIDITQGIQPQTEESLNFLKQFKTPFIVALTKIDRIQGWSPQEGKPFILTYQEQTQRVQDLLEEKIYSIIGQLAQHGFQGERYDRVSDYTKQVSLVPVSSTTSEGLPDILMILTGVAQKYLQKNLEIQEGEGKGTVLEVKEFKGLGVTIDVIVYDGEIKKGDYLIIVNPDGNTVESKIKALLEPKPLKEIKSAKDFLQINSISAAAGIKIAAPSLDNVVAGSPLRTFSKSVCVEKIKKELGQEIEEVEIESDRKGSILKADTLGGLEALVKSLKEIYIPIRKAHVCNISKSDIMEVKSLEDPVIFSFAIHPSPDILKFAKDNGVKIFHSDVIYTLIEEYTKWKTDKQRMNENAILEKVTRPGRVKVLRGYVFRQSKPAVFGVEIIKGTIKPKYRLMKDGKILGEVKEIQLSGENVREAKMGNKIALSMEGVTIGKDIMEDDTLDVFLNDKDLLSLDQIRTKLSEDERELLNEREI